jgi:hypothetical protein
VDKRNVIWISDVPTPEKPEPKVVFATVRDEFDSDGLESGWSLECRFDDDQKYGAVTVDRPFPGLAHRICDFLNSPQEVKITLSENERNEALRAISESTTPVMVIRTKDSAHHGLLKVREWKATDEGVVPTPAEVTKYLHGAPTPDEIEAFHAKDHVVISKDLWEATRAMAEAFIMDPMLKDAPTKEDLEAWNELVKFRERYEELRGDVH